MSPAQVSAIDILRKLNRSNCGECGVPTCLAFATLVSQGSKSQRDCPYLETDFGEIPSREVKPPSVDDDPEVALSPMKAEVGCVDFVEAARRLRVPLVDGRLAVRCLGRIFEVDRAGDLHTLCHVNPWVQGAVLHFVCHGKGTPATGDWAAFDELDGSRSWSRFFAHRCADELQRLVEKYGDALLDIFELFGRPPVDAIGDEDRAVVLYPLPGMPVLVRYWGAEGEFAAKLSLLFDRCVDANANPEWVYRILRGIVEMVIRIAQRHLAATA